MATVTHRVTTADTGGLPNTSGAFTPAVGDLLVVLVCVTNSTGASGFTFSSSIGGLTFSIARQIAGILSGAIWLLVADRLIAGGEDISQTVTIDTAPAGNGSVISVFSVSGMSNVGLSAVRQSAEQTGGGVGATPAPAFSGAALTTNPVLGIVMNTTNPAGLTAPSGWTEPAGGDTGYSSPTTGCEVCFRSSGETGTTITWGSTSATAFSAGIMELDAGGGGGDNPFFTQVGAIYQ